MEFGSILAVYFIIWWLTLFIVLPFGVRSQHEAGEIVAGSEPGAPAIPRMARVVLITTGVSAVFFAIFWLVYAMNVFDFDFVRDLKR